MSADLESPGCTWPGLLRQLLARQELDTGTATWAMNQVMAGEVTPAQLAAFVVALSAKGETATEVLAFSNVMLEHAVPIDVPGPAVDVVGTGGDAAHTVNISTMSAIVVAAAGARVIKHGNRAASSKCGSADVLEALGVTIDLVPAAVAECVAQLGIGFCFAPAFHPALRHAGPTRREIGIPTVFNILGPLANPARPQAAMVGCADPRLAPVMATVMADRGMSSLVVRGDDGLDEITIFDTTSVWDARSAFEPVTLRSFDAATAGAPRAPAGALHGGNAHFNAEVAAAVLAGERGAALDPVRDAVAVNAGAALAAFSSVGQAAVSPLGEAITEGTEAARDVLDAGAGAELLRQWVDLSARLAHVR